MPPPDSPARTALRPPRHQRLGGKRPDQTRTTLSHNAIRQLPLVTTTRDHHHRTRRPAASWTASRARHRRSPDRRGSAARPGDPARHTPTRHLELLAAEPGDHHPRPRRQRTAGHHCSSTSSATPPAPVVRSTAPPRSPGPPPAEAAAPRGWVRNAAARPRRPRPASPAWHLEGGQGGDQRRSGPGSRAGSPICTRAVER